MNNLLRSTQRFMNRNGATILTYVAGVGVVATAVMAAKATPKALELLEKAKEEKGEKLTKVEVIKTAAPAYALTVVMGVSTIACVFGANVLNKRQQAALMSAYAMLDASYKDYRKKVKELYGEDADGKVKEEIAKDKYEETEVPKTDGKTLFYDSFSERFFESTLAKVKEAEYEINHILACNGGAFLNEFYDLLDIPRVDYGDELGWSICMISEMTWTPWLEFWHDQKVMNDGREYYTIDMNVEPMMDFDDW